MRTRQTLGALAVAGLMTTGCLQKDMSETWYLEPAGAVSWAVVETDVRSDAQAAFDRQNEESGYFSGVQRQDHPIARAFRELGFIDVRTRVLRDTVPYTVSTDAKAGRLDVLGQRLIMRLGLAGTSVLDRQADAWQWTFTVRDPHAENATAPVSEDLQTLMNGFEGLKVVLVSGRFEDAYGFTLSSDHRVAKIQKLDDQVNGHDDDPVVVLRLRWTAGQAR
jgi:hypothetical protein